MYIQNVIGFSRNVRSPLNFAQKLNFIEKIGSRALGVASCSNTQLSPVGVAAGQQKKKSLPAPPLPSAKVGKCHRQVSLAPPWWWSWWYPSVASVYVSRDECLGNLLAWVNVISKIRIKEMESECVQVCPFERDTCYPHISHLFNLHVKRWEYVRTAT